MDGAEARA
ncbi:hypothetical protein CP01DC11_1470A, partial [Chlamydia psittaci 01DC11]